MPNAIETFASYNSFYRNWECNLLVKGVICNPSKADKEDSFVISRFQNPHHDELFEKIVTKYLLFFNIRRNYTREKLTHNSD